MRVPDNRAVAVVRQVRGNLLDVREIKTQYLYVSSLGVWNMIGSCYFSIIDVLVWLQEPALCCFLVRCGLFQIASRLIAGHIRQLIGIV